MSINVTNARSRMRFIDSVYEINIQEYNSTASSRTSAWSVQEKLAVANVFPTALEKENHANGDEWKHKIKLISNPLIESYYPVLQEPSVHQPSLAKLSSFPSVADENVMHQCSSLESKTRNVHVSRHDITKPRSPLVELTEGKANKTIEERQFIIEEQSKILALDIQSGVNTLQVSKCNDGNEYTSSITNTMTDENHTLEVKERVQVREKEGIRENDDLNHNLMSSSTLISWYELSSNPDTTDSQRLNSMSKNKKTQHGSSFKMEKCSTEFDISRQTKRSESMTNDSLLRSSLMPLSKNTKQFFCHTPGDAPFTNSLRKLSVSTDSLEQSKRSELIATRNYSDSNISRYESDCNSDNTASVPTTFLVYKAEGSNDTDQMSSCLDSAVFQNIEQLDPSPVGPDRKLETKRNPKVPNMKCPTAISTVKPTLTPLENVCKIQPTSYTKDHITPFEDIDKRIRDFLNIEKATEEGKDFKNEKCTFTRNTYMSTSSSQTTTKFKYKEEPIVSLFGKEKRRSVRENTDHTVIQTDGGNSVRNIYEKESNKLKGLGEGYDKKDLKKQKISNKDDNSSSRTLLNKKFENTTETSTYNDKTILAVTTVKRRSQEKVRTIWSKYGERNSNVEQTKDNDMVLTVRYSNDKRNRKKAEEKDLNAVQSDRKMLRKKVSKKSYAELRTSDKYKRRNEILKESQNKIIVHKPVKSTRKYNAKQSSGRKCGAAPNIANLISFLSNTNNHSNESFKNQHFEIPTTHKSSEEGSEMSYTSSELKSIYVDKVSNPGNYNYGCWPYVTMYGVSADTLNKSVRSIRNMKNKYSTPKNGNSNISKANKTNPGTMGIKSMCKEAFLNDRRGHSMKVKTTTKHTRITNNMEEKNVDVLMAPKYQHSATQILSPRTAERKSGASGEQQNRSMKMWAKRFMMELKDIKNELRRLEVSQMKGRDNFVNSILSPSGVTENEFLEAEIAVYSSETYIFGDNDPSHKGPIEGVWSINEFEVSSRINQ
ncbi:hypothetical protein RUM43_003838 [Polyplax serrata]|uniref:Uncharacterized protein n=1 Tax=Polyplax serrata TaxID=468196 RepID=A0AAN8P338_POLSC